MTSQLLSTPATHPFSIVALADKAWNTVVESALNVGWSASLASLAESAVVKVLSNIAYGQLRIETPSHSYVFPPFPSSADDGHPRAHIRVLKHNFWLRLALMSDLGFSEAYMFGEIECDNLIDIFSIFFLNKAALSTLSSSPFSSVCAAISQRLASSRFVNSIANSRSNISAHYDISNEMFMGFLSKDMTYSCAIFPDLDADLQLPGSCRSLSTSSRSSLSPEPSLPSSPELVGPTHQKFGFSSPVIGSLEASDRELSGSSTPTLVSESEVLLKRFKAKFGGYLRTRAEVREDDEDEDELYEAQMRKLQHIVQKCAIRPGMQILEIGSGWGALAIYITSTIPGTTIDTITLSSQQMDLVKERVARVGLNDSYARELGLEVLTPCEEDGGERKDNERVKVHLMDYRDMPPEWEGAFDRVVSVEMVEAVGKEFLETYWSKLDWALKKDIGVGVVQGITIPEARYDNYIRDVDFIRKWIFPGGHLPTLTHLITSLTAGSGGRLVVDSVSNIGPHYARTLREWRRRFEDAFEDVIKPALKKEYPELMCGVNGDEEVEVFKRKWIYYYCYCEIGFTTRSLGDHIITFSREGNQEFGCHVFA